MIEEVWAIGYDLNNKPTEVDYLLDSFSDPDSAITFADSITVSEIRKVTGESLVGANCFSIEIETTSVIDEEPMNVGTIYKRSIYYNSIIADVAISSTDYELLEDGSLKIPAKLLNKVKTKETINVLFKDDVQQPIIPFKIIGDCFDDSYICDIVF